MTKPKMGKKKKTVAGKVQATLSRKTHPARAVRKDPKERHAHKLAQRKKEKKAYTAQDWAAPAPSHLVAKLDLPKIKSKYQSYFEFADNPEKKKKKLEFTVTNNARPPPGFTFVPIGDPILTNSCKELSRERGAMIFIVSTSKEENSKISEFIHRTGYHFRESIVEDAKEIVGETVILKPTMRPGFIEPIPDSQEEINKQADGAIRDLFPRIPNTDRTMIIEHAFKKGGLFHGEPTVGLQTNIPLSRRVQLAVLAHIRHTHTRYDKLLRETSWMNARKAVEPVCLDVLVRWRGDEETGRDQMDEILREVVIITDSEGESDSSDDEDDDDDDGESEDGEVTSVSSTEPSSLPVSRNQQRPAPHTTQPLPLNSSSIHQGLPGIDNAISSRTRSQIDPSLPQENKARGFKRYQAAWEEAVYRRRERPAPGPTFAHTALEGSGPSRTRIARASPNPTIQHVARQYIATRTSGLTQHSNREDDREYNLPREVGRTVPYYSQQGSIPSSSFARDEVIVRSHTDRPIYHAEVPRGLETPSHVLREQRPPQVVRGPPVKRGPEDTPLPSIEPASSPHKDERHSLHQGFSHPQGPYPRRVIEPRLHSPAPREVIVINDDSPPVKRRRVVYEDNPGSFRPVSSRDHGLHSSALHSASHLILDAPQSEDLLVRRHAASTYPAQGLVRRQPEFYTDPVTSERLPVYDAQPTYSAQRSELARRSDMERPAPVRRVEDRNDRLGYSQASRDNLYVDTRPIVQNRNERFQDGEHGHSRQSQSHSQGMRLLSPQYPAHQQPRSHDGLRGPDQDFIHSFSQSHITGPSSHARNGFTVIAERSHENGHADLYREEHVDRSIMRRLPRASSPARYMERPLQHREEFQRQPAYESVLPSQSRHVPMDQPAALRREQYPIMPANPRAFRPADQRQPIYIVD